VADDGRLLNTVFMSFLLQELDGHCIINITASLYVQTPSTLQVSGQSYDKKSRILYCIILKLNSSTAIRD
jgi:hypothetical protein